MKCVKKRKRKKRKEKCDSQYCRAGSSTVVSREKVLLLTLSVLQRGLPLLKFSLSSFTQQTHNSINFLLAVSRCPTSTPILSPKIPGKTCNQPVSGATDACYETTFQSEVCRCACERRPQGCFTNWWIRTPTPLPATQACTVKDSKDRIETP